MSLLTALRTQQIIAYESGVADTIDPLGGSYYLERLTNDIEERACYYIAEIDKMGGALKATERGYIQQEIATSAYDYQNAVDSGEQVAVGVNKFTVNEDAEREILEIGQDMEQKQISRLAKLKKRT